jgi:uncharacterized protein (DUF1501 family)
MVAMILVGRGLQRTCQGLTRRAFLQAGASSVLGLSLADRLSAGGSSDGSAKAVVLLWLWGGPSQLDTWDPKPDAPLEFRGPFAAIQTRSPGLRFGELFPRLAARSDRFAVIRSLTTQSNDHGVAGTIGLTGSAAGSIDLGGKMAPGSPRPATGAVVAKLRGSCGGLPPFCVVGGKLHQGKKPIAGEGSGPLGATGEPFRLEYDPVLGTRAPALQLPAELPPERLTDRRKLLTALTELARAADAAGAGLDTHRARAFDLLTSPEARAAFDLSREPADVIDRYGRTRFGQSCLLARRLVEAGVPFVQVNWSDHVEAEEDAGDGGWDQHYRNFQIMQDRHGPWLDRTLPVFLDDLAERGLLKTTLVLVMGEFGRSPKINEKAGREHWPHCYSALVAGGGVVGGKVIGSSDARAEHPRDTPLTPADLWATVHHTLGTTSEQLNSLGLTMTGRVIEELF